ncbi:hypothetical protein KKA00_05410 [bacterium]|nr:hypothetical protein [bacterium]MBU1651634.1 hypothetical protein [bacterium]
MLIYLHGFASAGGQFKYKLLQRDFPDHKILSPTLPVEPRMVIEYVRGMIETEKDMTLMIGTSLGGFYAYYLAYKFQQEDLITPAVIINPSLEPWRTLKPALGKFRNFVSGEEFAWTDEHMHQLQDMASEIDPDKMDPAYLRFYVSTDDELLDHTGIEEKLPLGASTKYYDHSQHRFTRFSELFPEIKELYTQSRKDYIQSISPL